MGRLDIAHGGFGCEAEDAHEMDGVSGVHGFVQDPVLAEFGRAEAELEEDGVDDGEGYRRISGVVGGLPGGQQVGLAVRGQRRCRSLSQAIAWAWVSSSR